MTTPLAPKAELATRLRADLAQWLRDYASENKGQLFDSESAKILSSAAELDRLNKELTEAREALRKIGRYTGSFPNSTMRAIAIRALGDAK